MSADVTGGRLFLPRLHELGAVRTHRHPVRDLLPGKGKRGRTADDLEGRPAVIGTHLSDPRGHGTGEAAVPDPGGVSLKEFEGPDITLSKGGAREESCGDCHGYAHPDHPLYPVAHLEEQGIRDPSPWRLQAFVAIKADQDPSVP